MIGDSLGRTAAEFRHEKQKNKKKTAGG